MSAGPLSAEALVRVEFYDVDPMQVVWHGHYPRFLELGRNALLDGLGYGYRQMHEDGWSFPVVDLHIRYHKPAVLGQELRVRAVLVEWENRLVIDYEILDAAGGARLTKASSIQVAVRESGAELSFACPEGLVERVRAALERRP